MNTRGARAACAAALLATACGGTVGESATVPAAAVAARPAPTPAPTPVAASAIRLRGNALMGKDGYGIVPCGESAQRILEISPTAQPFLDKFLEGGAREFFVEAEGEHQADGHLRVLRFHRLYTEGPGCGVQMESMDFAAWGNEPFWAAISAKGELRLERPGATPLVARPIEWRQEDGGWVLSGQAASGPLGLRLVPGFCSDGMSDALYAWSATATVGREELRGCGFAGLADAPAPATP